MAVSVQDLIKKKDKILAKKKETFDLETSIGTITVQKISKSFAAEVFDLESGSDEYCILNAVVAPDLKSKELQDAYGCIEPTDIVGKLFDPGEIPAVARKIVSCAGYGKDIAAKIHKDVKN